MKIQLSIFILSFSTYLYAQRDSIFVSFPPTIDINTIIGRGDENPEGYAFVIYHFSDTDDFNSLIKLDYNAQETERLDAINIDDLNINYLDYTSGGYIAFGSLDREFKSNLYLSLFIKDDFSEITPIDTIIMDGSKKFGTYRFKKTPAGIYETVGTTRDQVDQSFYQPRYISADANGKFLTQKAFTVKNPTFVLDFLRLPVSNDLIFSLWNKETFLLDENFVFKDSMRNIYQTKINGTNFSDFYGFNYMYSVGGKIYCSGEGIEESDYNLTLAVVSTNPLQIDTVYPALPEGLPWDEVVLSHMGVDQDNNFINVGVGLYPPIFTGDYVNNLFIAKMNTAGDRLWAFRIRDTRMIVPHGILTDKNNDIILVGEYRDRGFEPGVRRNFLMKIYSDGTLSSTDGPVLEPIDFTLYPNPTSDIVHFETAMNFDGQVEIYTATGQLLKSLPATSSDNRLSLAALSPGTYFLAFKNKLGEIINIGKVQKT